MLSELFHSGDKRLSLIFVPDEILGFKEKDKQMSSASIKEIGFAPIIICY